MKNQSTVKYEDDFLPLNVFGDVLKQIVLLNTY